MCCRWATFSEGTIAPGEMRGGEDCEYVSQAPDDLTREWIERPEITVTGVRNFQVLDDEHGLADEAYLPITGTFDGFARQGVFRRHFFPGDNQTLFVENHTRLTMFVAGATTEGEQYERFYGYECGGVALRPERRADRRRVRSAVRDQLRLSELFRLPRRLPSGVPRTLSSCGEGSLVAFPVRNVLQLGATMGLLQAVEAGSPGVCPRPTTRSPARTSRCPTRTTCLAPSTSMGTSMGDRSCANLCAQLSGCSFFSYNPFTLKLRERAYDQRQLRIGGHVALGRRVSRHFFAGHGSPGAHRLPARADRPRYSPAASYPRGDVSGYCIRDAPGPDSPSRSATVSKTYGSDTGTVFRCQTCAEFYGTRTCSKRCPGLLGGENPCFRQVPAHRGSVGGLGETARGELSVRRPSRPLRGQRTGPDGCLGRADV